MEPSKEIGAVLEELGLSYEVEPQESEVIYRITVDSGEDLIINALLYTVGDEDFFRLMAYVDELSEEQPLEQLTSLMAINGELPLGTFCMDPEETVIYVTVNMPVREVDADQLAWVLELLFMAQELFYQDFYPAIPEGKA